MALCSLGRDSASSGTQSIVFTWSRLVGMATALISIWTVLSATDRTVNWTVERDNSSELPSAAVSSKLSLYPVSGSVALLSGRCTFPGERSTYIWSLGCFSTRNRTYLSRSSLYLLCPAACSFPVFSMARRGRWTAAGL